METEAATETPATMPAVEEAFEEIEVDAPLVGIIMGSASDKAKMQPAGEALHEAGIRYEVRVMSAHRDPEQVRDYCRNARMRGLKVIIAGAGMSAALPGVAASHSDLPVIGVPIAGRRAVEHRDTLCVGRTHGMHAEPTSFGLRLAGFAFEAERNLRRLSRAIEG